MSAWPTVRWSSADQIIAMIGDGEEAPSGSAVEPAAWFRLLRDAGDPTAAIQFIAHALPRYECVLWATRTVVESGVCDRTSEPIRAIMRWIDDPREERRRQVQAIAETMKSARPEYLLGMAVFFSGGSISTPELPAILPPLDSTAKMAGTAILNAADKGDRAAVLRRATELGEAIAAAGPVR